MPEGDSVHKVAKAMQPWVGRELLRCELWGREVEDLRGARIEEVHARGKHLLIDFDAPLGLRVHLGMKGKWRRYGPGDPPPRFAGGRPVSLALTTTEETLCCLKAKEVERVAGKARWSRALGAVGPDLLGDYADEPSLEDAIETMIARARGTRPERAVLDVLLDQAVAAGIGNVYKSELLFLHGLHPGTPARELDAATWRAIFVQARELLAANLGPQARVTRGEPVGERPRRPGEARFFVYGRSGQPCLRCEAEVRYALTGDPPRGTYWCPRCQPESS